MKCPQCKKEYEPKLVRPEGDNRLIQQIFPNASSIEREQLITGICSDKCWNEFIGMDLDEDHDVEST